MEIKDWIKPEYFKFVIAIIALLILERSISFLVGDTPFMFFDGQQPQPGIKRTLDWEIPAATMTILWPIVFAIANSIHKNLRVHYLFFYLVIIVHCVTCFWAAYLVYDQHEYTSILVSEFAPTPENPGYELVKSNVVLTILAGTVISVAVASIMFSKKIQFVGENT